MRMKFYGHLLVCCKSRGLLLLCAALLSLSLDQSEAVPQSNLQRGTGVDYEVTHTDIRDALLMLVNVIHEQAGKLERHELRERQLGEQLSKTLGILEKRTRPYEKNFENMAKFLMSLDEKIRNVQAAVDRQGQEARRDTEQIRRELVAAKQAIPAASSQPNVSSNLARIESKLTALDTKFERISSSSEQNSQKLDELNTKIKETASEAAAAAASAAAEVTSHNSAAIQQNQVSETALAAGAYLTPEIADTLNDIKEALQRTADLESQLLSSKLVSGGEEESSQGEMTQSLELQRRQLAQLEEEVEKTLSVLGTMADTTSSVQTTLLNLQSDTLSGFQKLEDQFEALQANATEEVGVKLEGVETVLKNGQQMLENKVTEAETQLDNLIVKTEAGYEQLSRELKGLSNVESVLLDTGDSVLDTKRRLEYGVQQIMGEMNNQLNTYTTKLNDSVQQRFDGLAVAVLGNQSIALTNLTSRMEGEISQVWRQIGILYHQVSRSAQLLDEIYSQTSKYVNISMDSMSSMEGKLGAITNSTGDVSENMNYILGRMALVFQEFSMLKGGLGEALQSLRDSFAEMSDADKLKTTVPPPQQNTGEPVKVPIPDAELQALENRVEAEDG